MLWLLPVLLLAPRGAVVESLPGRVQVDWTAGRITAVGVGAPDLRAPGPAVARVTAERVARREAQRRLLETAARVPLAQGGTPTAARLEAAKPLVHDLEIRYASDGAVEATLALPLEAVRLALEAKPPQAPTGDDAAPTAVVVELGKVHLAPVLGVTVAAGATRFAGPTIWYKDAKAARDDPRLGPRPLEARASAAKGGVLTLEVDEARLAAAARAGALVVIVSRLWEGKR
jgi:hypothetical protein